MKKTSQSSHLKRLFLVDGSALAYRSHFALSHTPLTNSQGEATGAIFGFIRGLLQLIDDENPTHIAVVFDTPEPTFRHKAYAEYKATRPKMPDDLANQFPKIKEFVKVLGIQLLEYPGYEADDVMGTLAVQATAEELQVFLYTSDKDLMQLVNEKVFMYYTGRNNSTKIMDAEAVKEKLGVLPHQVIDYLTLLGDTSDNVPGVPKVGVKTAVSLLEQFDSLDNIFENSDQVKRASVRESLKANYEQALLSRELVTIDKAVPVTQKISELALDGINHTQAAELCKMYNFSSLLSRFTESAQSVQTDYQLINTEAGILQLVEKLKQVSLFAFDTETSSADPLRAELVGMSFSWQEGSACYVPVAQSILQNDFSDFYLEGEDVQTELSLKKIFQPLLEDPALKKCGQNVKYDMLVMARYGVFMQGFSFDTMLASYILNPALRQHNLDALCMQHFNYRKIPTSDLLGKGKKQKTMREIPVADVAKYAGEDADFTFRLYKILAKKLNKGELQELFETIEMPLIDVLMVIEQNGITLDLPFLTRMSETMAAQLEILIADIYKEAQEEFNINSNQQLAHILFEKMGMPRKRRTKTGYSTDARVLEELAKDYDLPRKLLEYRELTKLKSTYVDALPKLVNPYTRKLHTSFNQTVAATGRLSSSDPNLQNIPIRTELGRKIREAFVPSQKGWVLFDADYSQIELRLMAHFSQDEALITAFRNDEDIHTATACRMFDLKPEDMTTDLRRSAKEINFGILYGMGAYGLSRRLNISNEEAQNFISHYFVQYPGINQFIIGTIADAHKNGYVSTMFKRRRLLPDIKSSNNHTREGAERIAVNTPIQGTAADLIKIAMINIHHRLKKEKMQARMLLQVHDELVFEAPEAEQEQLRTLVIEEMSDAIRLDVPIKVEAGVGKNWLEAH